MKTLSAFVVMLFLSLILSETAFSSDLKKGPKKIPKNSIESIIIGLNSDNKGLIIGCAMMAGDSVALLVGARSLLPAIARESHAAARTPHA